MSLNAQRRTLAFATVGCKANIKNCDSNKNTVLKVMFDEYFDGWEIKPSFRREYISLWSGWLGESQLHKLDAVSESEWARFNSLISSISKKYTVGLADCDAETIVFPENVSDTFQTYAQSMQKDASRFTKYVIPHLKAIITEEWDFTYILWYRTEEIVETLSPFIKASKLKHFND